MAACGRTWLGAGPRRIVARCLTARRANLNRPQVEIQQLSTAPPSVPITELTLLRYEYVSTAPAQTLLARFAWPRFTFFMPCRFRYVDGMLEKRGNVEDPSSPRAGHIEHAKAALASGDLLIAGALADPVDEALFIWKGDAKVAAEDFGALALTSTCCRISPGCRGLSSVS